MNRKGEGGAVAIVPVRVDSQRLPGKALLREFQHPAWRHWVCRGCGERIDGPFEQCWNCGAGMPA